MNEREFFREHEKWVMQYHKRINNWGVCTLKDANPKVIADHGAFSSDQGVRFSAMAVDEMVRDGALELCEALDPDWGAKWTPV